MKKDKIINILSITFVIAVFIGLIIYILNVDGLDNIINILSNVSYKWLLAGLVFTVIYWLLEGLCFYLVSKKINKKQRFISSFRLAMIGRLFNNITPFSAGDQPVQLLVLNKEGKSISDAASILLTRFIVYQFVLVIYTIVVMLLKYSYFASLINNFMFFAIIGFALNIVTTTILVTLVVNERIILKIGVFALKFLGKIKLLKKSDELILKLEEAIIDFKKQIDIIKKEKMMMFKMAIYTAIEITVLYTITYIVYRAFGQSGADFWTIISAQAILAMITVYMPTPGAGVAAEGGFYIIFSTFFAANTINLSILFWRMFTFYLPILVGLVFFIKKPKELK